MKIIESEKFTKIADIKPPGYAIAQKLAEITEQEIKKINIPREKRWEALESILYNLRGLLTNDWKIR